LCLGFIIQIQDLGLIFASAAMCVLHKSDITAIRCTLQQSFLFPDEGFNNNTFNSKTESHHA
ncbi:MAG: hypothetical protein M3261_01860, partial [Thermoproteota archaeon]|nr:hypothetical protein [Thermoproteota archaeon]